MCSGLRLPAISPDSGEFSWAAVWRRRETISHHSLAQQRCAWVAIGRRNQSNRRQEAAPPIKSICRLILGGISLLYRHRSSFSPKVGRALGSPRFRLFYSCPILPAPASHFFSRTTSSSLNRTPRARSPHPLLLQSYPGSAARLTPHRANLSPARAYLTVADPGFSFFTCFRNCCTRSKSLRRLSNNLIIP